MVLGRLPVTEGPGVYDTLLTSVKDGKPVRFTLADQGFGKLFIGDPSRHVTKFLARIFLVRRLDNGAGPDPTDDFFVKGEVLASSGSGIRIGLLFSGFYNTFSRDGDFKFEVRPYEPGDLIMGNYPGFKHIPMCIEQENVR